MFEGNKCPYCGKEFISTDDIVVCPECGTPHHRACYKEHNACANVSKHGSYVWEPVNVKQVNKENTSVSGDPNQQELNDIVICEVCGQQNKTSSKYCSRCGNLLKNNSLDNIENERVIEVQQISADAKIDGIPIRDWLVYLGPTAVSHIRTYLKQNVNQFKWGISLGAFFFPVLFYLYYKVWDIALLILLIDIICNVPTIMLQLNYPIASMLGMSLAQFTNIANILSYIYLAIIFVLSLFSKTIVRKKSSKKIKTIRRSCTNESDYSALLLQKSCPNKIVVASILILYILSFAFLLFT